MPVIDHCEDSSLKGDGVAHEGYHASVLGLRGIPGAAEAVMVERDVLLAEQSRQTATHLGSGLPHPLQLHGKPLRNADVVSAHQSDQLASSLPHSDVLRRGPVTPDPLEHAYSGVMCAEAPRHVDRPVRRAVVDQY